AHAPQAAVEVLGDGVAPDDLALREPAHQIDAPAGRVHLLPPGDVGRACRKTKPAVHAIVEQRALAHRALTGVNHHSPFTNHTSPITNSSRFPRRSAPARVGAPDPDGP